MPTELCQRHSPNGLDQTADLTLGQPAIDPETGQPVDPTSSEEPRYSITDDGLQIKDPGGDEPITISPAKTFPPHPITVPAAGAAAAPTAPAGEGSGDGSILIRPTTPREHPDRPARPAPPQDMALTGPVGMVQGNGVVPAGSQAIGKKAEPPAEQKPAEDQSGDQDTSTETSPPPG